MSGTNTTPGFFDAHNNERTRDMQQRVHQRLEMNENHGQHGIIVQNRNEVNDDSTTQDSRFGNSMSSAQSVGVSSLSSQSEDSLSNRRGEIVFLVH
jgi:enoyl reductase-like protein